MPKLKKFLLPLFIALAVLVAGQVALAAVNWPNYHLNLSKATLNAGYPAIAVSSNAQNIGMVWSQGFASPTNDTAHGPIYLKAASTGITISVRTAVDFANSADNQSFSPDVAADPLSAHMYVVWKNLKPAAATVYLTRCATTTGGGCLSPPITGQTINLATGNVNDPRIATSKQNIGGVDRTVVHLVWQAIDYSAGERRIRYASWYWNGSALLQLTAPVAVSSVKPVWGDHPAIAVSTSAGGYGTYVHIAWASDDFGQNDVNENIRYRRGTLNATTGLISTWTPALINNGNSFLVAGSSGIFSDGNPDHPALAAAGSKVMLLWDEEYQFDSANEDEYYLAYALSTDDGTTIPFPTKDVLRYSDTSTVVYLSDGQPTSPANNLGPIAERLQVQAAAEYISTGQSNFYIVWHSNEGTNPLEPYHNIFYNKYCAGGTSGGCGTANKWLYDEGSNETGGYKYAGPYAVQNRSFYSMAPDVAVAAGGTGGSKVYAVYMEGNQDAESSLAYAHFDVIYNGTVRLTDTTRTGDGGVYLPVVIKNR